LASFADAISADRAFADAYSNMGNVYRALGRLADAVSSYGQAIAKRPDHAEAWGNLAISLRDQGRTEDALRAFRLAILLRPDLREAHYNFALLLDGRGQPAAALASYGRSIALVCEAAAYNGRASILLQQRRLDVAEAALRRAAALDPAHALAQNNAGMLHQGRGQLLTALTHYRRALAIDRLYAEACNNLGSAYRDLGAVGPTIAMYARAIALAPGFVPAIYNLGLALYESGRLDGAMTYFDRVEVEDSSARSLYCTYKTGGVSSFRRKLQRFLKTGHVFPLVANLSSHHAANFREEDPYDFCKTPLDFVYRDTIEALARPGSTLKSTLLRDILGSSLSERQQGHLYEGVQSSGLLFERPEASFRELASHVLTHVDRYFALHRGQKCTFIEEFPTDRRFLGSWFIRMRQGGHLTSHIHESGWLSGVVYLSVPQDRTGNEGNIEFSIDGDGYPTSHADFPSRIVPVQAGDIVLFPSSLFHRTIAFESAEERICIAFDIAPRKFAVAVRT
jgi:tetratricopeptide (TPR) repeat protein